MKLPNDFFAVVQKIVTPLPSKHVVIELTDLDLLMQIESLLDRLSGKPVTAALSHDKIANGWTEIANDALADDTLAENT